MLFDTFREHVANFIYPEQLNERRALARAANVDPLTGLANRRAFDLALPAAELDPDLSIVVFDANNFGKLNKIAGHKFGDLALKEMADAIALVAVAFGCRERVFRIGGDEFVVIAPNAIAARLRDRVEQMFGIRFPAVRVSISGTVGNTFAAADAEIQKRKEEQKQCQK